MTVPTCWEGAAPRFHGNPSTCALDSSGSHSTYLFIWLFIYILYNKLINNFFNIKL